MHRTHSPCATQLTGKPVLSQTPGRCCRDLRTCAIINKANFESRSAAALGALELPHGVLWWQDKQHSVYQHDVLYGQDFVLQRQRSGGPGLVLSQRLSSVQIVDKRERERVQLATYKSAHAETGIQLAVNGLDTFDLTDYSLLEDSDPAEVTDHLDGHGAACTGIVLWSSQIQPEAKVCSGVATPSRAPDHLDFTCVPAGQ